MRRTIFKSKIHRATVTHADLDYDGSVTLDADLMRAAAVLPHDGLTPYRPWTRLFVLVLDHLVGVVPPLVARRMPRRRDGPLDGPGGCRTRGRYERRHQLRDGIEAAVLHHCLHVRGLLDVLQ